MSHAAVAFGRFHRWLAILFACGLIVFGMSAQPTAARDRTVERAAAALTLAADRFTLPNGLRVVVHTDRKAPVVAVSLHYAVGSRNETPDRAGFAHLFEHLMFSGSDNAPGDVFGRMRALGATGVNGNTGYDATVFYETVPRPALERALFLEADRMAHMDRAIDQRTLDVNRDIVQNEKRQNENQPYGLAYHYVFARLFPPGHPYGHSVIGSMAALDAARVEDARAWHRRFYRPNNAVLVLAGDIDVDTARTLVIRYFGGIPAGPPVVQPAVSVPVLDAPIADTEHDQVADISVTRHWLTPGRRHPDALALDLAAKILGTLTGSWLDEAMLHDNRLASSVTTSSGASFDLSTFIISYTVAPGVDPKRVADRLDAVLARFAREGPSEDEIRRVVMRDIGWTVQGLETTGMQAAKLGDGILLHDDPLAFQHEIQAQARLRPADVAAVVRRWLLCPAYTLSVVPGARPAYTEALPPASPRTPVDVPASTATSVALPPVGAIATLRFPAISRARLSNGIEIVHARRAGTPLTRVAMTFDGGTEADPADAAGAQAMMLAMLMEGSTSRDGAAIARDRQRIGADMDFQVGPDQTVATLTAPSASLQPALALLADIVRHPAMTPSAFERVRANRLAAIRQEANQPALLAERIMAQQLYGTAPGDAAAIAGLTPDRLLALHRARLRPETARLFVVSDLSLAEVREGAERAFGDWHGVGSAGGIVVAPAPQATSRIVLVDRPDSPQSLILGATRSPLEAQATPDDLLAMSVANDALGGWRGRINLDLRERLGWSYGATGGFRQSANMLAYSVVAPVQTDRTGAAIDEIRRNLADYVGSRPVNRAEFDGIVTTTLASLPGRFESGAAVLAAMQANQLFGRADDYPVTLPARLRALSPTIVAETMRRAIDPTRMIWVVVGDARRVRPQLEQLGLPIVTSPAQ